MTFDYVIVGGGSAGCVLAHRLSENPDTKVCLLEAGKPDNSQFIHMPAGMIALLTSKSLNWGFETTPQRGLNGRRGFQPRGKTLGGSSSINAMVYIRGHAKDYDDWAALGNDGWGYQDVLPYFKKSQNQERGGDAFHGTGGPLNVADVQAPNPLNEAFCQAADQIQIPRASDFNGAEQEGVGLYQVTQKNGERCSAAKGYLTPIKDRPNLTIITEAHATKVEFDGKRASGVRYVKNKKSEIVQASGEVILSGGAFNSPQLLMLSGIGAGNSLKQTGIDVVHDLPGVGQNLQDHPDFIVSYKSDNKDLVGFSPKGIANLVSGYFEYRKSRTGRMTTNYAEAGGFLKTDPNLERPDIQLHLVGSLVDDHGRKLHLAHGFSCHACLLRPKSRGGVTLASGDPLAAPLIDPGFLNEEQDMDNLVSGVRMMDRILSAPALSSYRGKPLYPFDIDDDQSVREAIRQRADTVYHPVGTCKMGRDALAVVDARLRVRGVQGLRVVDASIMPTLIGGNTNAPAIMIGEKASDMIREDAVA